MSKSKCIDNVNLIEERVHRKYEKSISFTCFLILSLFVLSFGSFAIWYNRQNRFYLFRILDKNIEEFGPVCSDVPNIEKFDCFPESSVSEKACLDRGCCYQVVGEVVTNVNSSVPPLKTPYCYYPSKYNGYSIYSTSVDGQFIKVKLRRNFPSGFPADVQDLLLVISSIDDNLIRIKITDSKYDRFEVPIPINVEIKPLKFPSYIVDIDPQSNLVITRKSSGKVIFNTTLSKLVYSDQFLQISSRLPSSYIYGIGESYRPLLRDVKWSRITLFNSDQEPIPDYPLYGSQPFYLSLEQSGDANGVFLLNSNAMDVILQPTPAITFRPIGGILDFFIMLGPSPANVVQQYTSLVGRTFMPPYWSLGFHLCRYGYNSLNKTKETLQRNVDAGIPIDVQWNDIDYMERYKDFTYDQVAFAGLPEFADELHKQGRHYVIMTDPGLSNSEKPGTYPPYDEGVTDDIFMKNPNGSIFVGKVWNDGNTVFPDFSHPNATTYWSRQFQNFYNKVKFDGVWIDMNEPSNFVDGGINGCIDSSYEDPPYLPGNLGVKLRHKTACMTAKHYKTIHYNEHNLLGYREAAATSQSLKTIRNKRPFIISRATFSGQGVHSGHWSGDIASTWEDMRYTIPSTINFNLYGMSMIGSDICGFNQNTTVELCARWQALGAFYPFSRNHNERVTIEQDPFALGPTVVNATKNALNIRYYLLPYLYSLFYRSHAYGETVVRPTFFEFPKEKGTYSQDEQFLWGSAMMVIPALYPNTRNVVAYLPQGVWYPNTPVPVMIQSNGGNYTFTSDVTNINMAFRGGYIVPGQINSLTTTESRKNSFVLAVALDENKEATGELYWDDGDSLNTYENNVYNLISFNASKKTLKSTVLKQGYKEKMNLSNIMIVGVSPLPTEVTFNGINCAKRMDLKEPTDKFQAKPWFMRHSELEVSSDQTCVFSLSGYFGVGIGLQPTSLLSPFTVTWK